MTKNLDIIVPILNEEKSISELVFRVDKSLKEAGITYRLIFVDDHSVDGTVKVVKSLTKNYPIYLHIKEGEVGKAYSILEGSKIATSEYIAMIDGDLQYPPEAIPEMYKIAKEKGVAVANRKTHNTSFVRKFASKANAFVFGRLLLGLNCDTQSGLKIFKREIIQELSVDEVTRWTLDMPLLHTALELGYEIGTVDIEFADRKNGQSKVALFKTSKEIALGAVKLRAKKRKVYHIKPEREGSMIGAGVIHKRKHFITHTNLPHHQSAIRTFTRWQKAFALALELLFLLA